MSRLSVKTMLRSFGAAALVLALAFGVAQRNQIASGHEAQERKLEQRLFGNVLELVKAENLEAANFPHGLQLEVKNISAKPIYYIRFQLVLPQIKEQVGTPNDYAFPLSYGNARLGTSQGKVTELDKPLMPGETTTITVGEKLAQGVHNFMAQHSLSAQMCLSQIVLRCNFVNFGDGTSYAGVEANPRAGL